MPRRKPTSRSSADPRRNSPHDKADLPLLQRARALWIERQYDAALKLFEKAVQQHPRNRLALIDASRALGSQFEIKKGEKYLQRLLQLGGDAPDVLCHAGQSYRLIHRRRQAVDCFQRSVAAGSKDSFVYLELAMLQERSHELAAAEATIAVCVELDPSSVEGRLVQARVWRRLGRGQEAQAALLAIVESSQTSSWTTRAQAWTELARLAEEQGDYRQAFAWMEQGKQLAKPHASEYEAISRRGHKLAVELLDRLSPECFQRWRDAARNSPDDRVALLTGPPRSGTTLLEKVLDAHPDVVSSDEVHVFSGRVMREILVSLGTASPEIAQLDAVSEVERRQRCFQYFNYMEQVLNEPIDGRLLLDKNPALIRQIPMLLRLFPNLSIIYALRDPRDVVVSSFMCNLGLNATSVHFLTLEGAVDRYVQDMEFWTRLRDMIPAVVSEPKYEDMIDDLPTHAKAVLQSLNLPWAEELLDYRQHLLRRPTESPTYEAVARPLYRSAIGRWRSYEEQLQPYLERLDPWVKKLGYA